MVLSAPSIKLKEQERRLPRSQMESQQVDLLVNPSIEKPSSPFFCPFLRRAEDERALERR